MEYIPQAEPFVMIDQVLAYDSHSCTCKFNIKSDNIFINELHQLTEPGLIENMAQTAAAGAGILAINNNEKPAIGFIGQIKNLIIFQLPKVGDTIETSTITKHQVLNASIVMAEIKLNEQIIAQAEYKIFLQE